jgi:hypothetical protein
MIKGLIAVPNIQCRFGFITEILWTARAYFQTASRISAGSFGKRVNVRSSSIYSGLVTWIVFAMLMLT